MAKVLIDANVILRYLLRDDEGMADKANIIITNGAFTLPEILAEVVYVLSGVYKVERQEISDALLAVLDVVEVEHFEVIFRAIEIFANSGLDFVDCILIAYNEIEKIEVFSFDKKLNRRLIKKFE